MDSRHRGAGCLHPALAERRAGRGRVRAGRASRAAARDLRSAGNEFYRAKVDVWTRNDVLINFGRPAETAYFPRMKREVWSYRYMENNIDYLMFNFYFDEQGILRLTQKTPDPMRERNLRRGL
jgi:hypothetical protein